MVTGTSVSKSYGKQEVLKECTFFFKASKLTAITGASGSGKSTLFNIIGGLDNCDSGEVLIDGENITNLKGKNLARYRNQSLGFVFQDHRLLPELSAKENVLLPAMIGKNSGEEIENYMYKLLELLKISGLENKYPAELSGGERQRFSVARALINSPKLILADEPSGALDQANANRLQDIFRELCDELNSTIVFVTHNESLAHKSDEIWHLESKILTKK